MCNTVVVVLWSDLRDVYPQHIHNLVYCFVSFLIPPFLRQSKVPNTSNTTTTHTSGNQGLSPIAEDWTTARQWLTITENAKNTALGSWVSYIVDCSRCQISDCWENNQTMSANSYHGINCNHCSSVHQFITFGTQTHSSSIARSFDRWSLVTNHWSLITAFIYYLMFYSFLSIDLILINCSSNVIFYWTNELKCIRQTARQLTIDCIRFDQSFNL